MGDPDAVVLHSVGLYRMAQSASLLAVFLNLFHFVFVLIVLLLKDAVPVLYDVMSFQELGLLVLVGPATAWITKTPKMG